MIEQANLRNIPNILNEFCFFVICSKILYGYVVENNLNLAQIWLQAQNFYFCKQTKGHNTVLAVFAHMKHGNSCASSAHHLEQYQKVSMATD